MAVMVLIAVAVVVRLLEYENKERNKALAFNIVIAGMGIRW